jgi:hypothetical protein
MIALNCKNSLWSSTAAERAALKANLYTMRTSTITSRKKRKEKKSPT